MLRALKEDKMRATIKTLLTCSLIFGVSISSAFARDIEYKGSEAEVFINTGGEPTQVRFPGKVVGGYKSKISTVTVERKESDIILFAQESLSDVGDAIIVRLEDGRSYSLRVKPANEMNPRDTLVKVEDGRGVFQDYAEEDAEGEAAYKEKDFAYAPSSTVSGLMREMVLVAEFGKKGISGYRVSDRYKGEPILNDGAISAVIDRIFIGPNLWGYVVDASNLLDQGQKINPASFRIDGTRAIMAEKWELSPKPLNIEQQIARGDKSKIYIVTRAKG
jgi:hypothetical protein